MPVLIPGPTRSGFLPKKRFAICSSGKAIGGTTLETIRSCTSAMRNPAKSKSALICKPYSSPVRSFSVCTRNESRSLPASNTPSTVLVFPTSMARSIAPTVSRADEHSVNLLDNYMCLQNPALLHISRHHAHNSSCWIADQQRAVLVEVGGVSFDQAAVAGDAHAVPEGGGELAPAVAHRTEPLGLVEAEPLLDVLEQPRHHQRPGDALAGLDQEAGGPRAQLLGKIVHLHRDVEAHPEDAVPDPVGLGAQLGEQARELAGLA